MTNSEEDLNNFMPMYNLLEYSSNYCMTSGSLLNYHRNEVNNYVIEYNAANFRMNNNKTTPSTSFKYKANVLGSLPADYNSLDAELIVPLKYLIIFCRS